MIVGRGLIALAFNESYKENHSFTIFASGVSNSNETDPLQYMREKQMILDHIDNQSVFVYFSTCSVYDSYLNASKYVQHKLEMELLIKNQCNRFVLFRLPQVAGFSKNKNTLMNYFSNKIINDDQFELFDVERNIIDINDVFRIIDNYLNLDSSHYLNRIINIAFPKNIKVISLVNVMESFYNKKAKYTIRKIQGYSLNIEIEERVRKSFISLDVNEYLSTILSKYYV